MREAKLFQFFVVISLVSLAPMLMGSKILPSMPSINAKVGSVAGGIGPGTLPNWYMDAQVQLGWIFDDPLNPGGSEPLPEWNTAVGDIPVWTYDPDGTVYDHPAQWYIRIPNLVNDHPSKKFWISWIYEFDSYYEGDRSATNINWYPATDSGDPQYLEEWFDVNGDPTTDHLQAAYARVTLYLDMYPNPQYEDVWLGVYGGTKNALEVYIITLCVEEIIPEGIGPGTLPDWHEDAQVQLGWIFDDPLNPGDSTPLTGWDIAIGEIPTWTYDPDGTVYDHPAQWYIRIPNLVNDHPSKKFWISWVYEFDTYIEGIRSATNIEWYPDSGHENVQYLEEWFDSDGELTTDYLQATHARVTHSLDLYPNPQYEDVWLGVYGGSKNAVEVYIKTLCVEEIEPVTIGPGTLPDWHEDAQVQLGWIFDDPLNPGDSTPIPGWDKAIGDIPTWSYEAERTVLDQPGQWYVRIANLDNENPSKKVWISWVYEFDPNFEGAQAAINIDWDPNTDMDNPYMLEEWFDSEGELTTDQGQAAYGRVTGSLDLFPNPQYEDIWLGTYNSLNALEVYIKTLCIPEPISDVDVEVTLRVTLSPENFDFTTDIKLGSDSEIDVNTNIKFSPEGIEVTADISLGTNNLEVAMNFGLESSFDEEMEVIISIKLSTSEDGLQITTDFELSTPSSVVLTTTEMNIITDSFEFNSDVEVNSNFDSIEVSTNFNMNPEGIMVTTAIGMGSIEAILDIQFNSGSNPS
ncbi:MAG: hypothetical protein JSW11_05535 [Candidatus Heimdallarchaeota archaeon]|nr:MAG: hypothetical protein JSW11_05535 [Candidatus Heimdallarchaeota archaeon]